MRCSEKQGKLALVELHTTMAILPPVPKLVLVFLDSTAPYSVNISLNPFLESEKASTGGSASILNKELSGPADYKLIWKLLCVQCNS